MQSSQQCCLAYNFIYLFIFEMKQNSPSHLDIAFVLFCFIIKLQQNEQQQEQL